MRPPLTSSTPRGFRATGEHVAGRPLAKTFVEQIGEFVAGGDAVEIRRVFLFGLVEIQTVIVRVVEEVALDAPGFVVDLLPHGTGLDVDFPSVEFEWTETGLGRGCAAGTTTIIGGRGRPGVALAVKNFLAVEGDGEVIDVLDQL